MSPEALQEVLKKLQERLRSSPPPNERAVYTGFIEPLLRALGWDTDDYHEVYPEYSSGRGRVDYALRIREGEEYKPIIFIEVKQPGGLDENAETQLFAYAAHEGVPAAILTDGQTWRLYYPLTSGKPADRFVYSVDLLEDSLPELLRFFQDFLDKSSITSRRKYEEKIRKVHLKNVQLLKLQEIWEELQRPGSEFYGFLAKRLTEKLGEEVTPEEVQGLWEEFFSGSPKVSRHKVSSPKAFLAPRLSSAKPGWVLWYKGTQLSDPKLRKLIAKLFCHVAREYPNFLEGFYQSKHNGGHVRKYIGKSPDELFQGSKISEPEKHALPLPCDKTWYLMVNFGKDQARAIVEAVSEYLRLPFRDAQRGIEVDW